MLASQYSSGRALWKEVTREGPMKGERLVVERQVTRPRISFLTIRDLKFQITIGVMGEGDFDREPRSVNALRGPIDFHF
jgi:hypothetical protein